jgi:hypothetical protein
MFSAASPAVSQAKFADFAVQHALFNFVTISSDGSSSVHELILDVSREGKISGRAMRFDAPKRTVGAVPRNGTVVRILPASSLAGPISSRDVSFMHFMGGKSVEKSCFFAVFLSDGSILKGRMWRLDQRLESGSSYQETATLGMRGASTYLGRAGGEISWQCVVGGGGGSGAGAAQN